MPDIITFCSQVKVDRSSSTPGPWVPDSSPWIIEPLKAVDDIRTRHITCVASAQSSKTLFSLLSMAYLIVEKPCGGIIYSQPTQHDADTIMRQRVTPFLREVESIAPLWPTGRHEASLTEINFPHLVLNVASANALSALQGRPAAYVIADEVRLYQTDQAIPLLSKRTRTFYSSKMIMISCPDRDDDILWSRYSEGTMEEYHVRCPHCSGHFFPLFRHLKYDEIKMGDDDIDYNQTANSVRMICPLCTKEIADRADIRYAMSKNGTYVQKNPNAVKGSRSFRWNALIPPRNSWSGVVMEFLQAQRAKKLGLYEPLKTFVNETLAEVWETDRYAAETYRDVKPEYQPSVQRGEGEIERFMGCDYQAGKVGQGSYFVYGVYAFFSNNKVKLLAEGTASDFGALEAIAKEWGVGSRRVLVDCAYSPSDIYSGCTEFRFSPIRGSKYQYFSYKDGKGKTIKRLWRITNDDPMRGQHTRHNAILHRVYEFANDALTGITYSLINDSARFYVYSGVSEDYKKQLKSVKREKSKSGEWAWKIGKDDHAFDSLKMAICGAIMSGSYSLDVKDQSKDLSHPHDSSPGGQT